MGVPYILSAILIPVCGALCFYILSEFRESKAEIKSIQNERATEKNIYLTKMKSLDHHICHVEKDIDDCKEEQKNIKEKIEKIFHDLGLIEGKIKIK
jgi:peptidoglycan hydrolase CwlO-like protein